MKKLKESVVWKNLGSRQLQDMYRLWSRGGVLSGLPRAASGYINASQSVHALVMRNQDRNSLF